MSMIKIPNNNLQKFRLALHARKHCSINILWELVYTRNSAERLMFSENSLYTFPRSRYMASNWQAAIRGEALPSCEDSRFPDMEY